MSDNYLFLSMCAGLTVEVTDVCSTLQELYSLDTIMEKLPRKEMCRKDCTYYK